jgi:predicted transcriptional regulator
VSASGEIKKARRVRDLSQDEVSNETTRSQFWLSLVERGKVVLDPAATQQLMLAIERAGDRKDAIERAIASVNEAFDAKRDSAEHLPRDFKNRKPRAEIGL